MAGRYGRRRPHPESTHPRLKLAHFLAPDYPKAPDTVDYTSGVPSWPMYANDRWGDCFWAMVGHQIEAATLFGAGAEQMPTEEAILAGYSACTGFDPNAGAPGENSTDNGTVMQDGLSFWRKTGIEMPDGTRHKILAFAQVDHTNDEEMAAALELFGHLALGVQVPASAEQQFDAGEPWDVVRGNNRILGLHAINLGFFSRHGNDKVVTWGRLQELTLAWRKKYIDEAWIVITPEWLAGRGGKSPAGLDAEALNELFVTMTGDPAPFPVQPAPVPPGPTPGPDADPADVALGQALRAWLTAKGV